MSDPGAQLYDWYDQPLPLGTILVDAQYNIRDHQVIHSGDPEDMLQAFLDMQERYTNLENMEVPVLPDQPKRISG